VRVWLVLLIGAVLAIAQEEQKPPRPPQESFFSGNVVSFDSTKVTVTRRTLTLSWITKTFLLDSDTKIEGMLKTKARITVKFEKTVEGDRAIHIIVR
jgi:hypothetical protein